MYSIPVKAANHNALPTGTDFRSGEVLFIVIAAIIKFLHDSSWDAQFVILVRKSTAEGKTAHTFLVVKDHYFVITRRYDTFSPC